MEEAAAIGVDIGGTNLRVALVSRTGEVLLAHREALRARALPEVIEQMRAALLRLPVQATALPLGVAIAAMLRRDGRVRVAPNLGWRDLDLRSAIEQMLGAPIVILNDLDAAVIAEGAVGAGVGCDTVLLCSVGSGVGGGLLFGGKLHRGAGGVAGEIGHVKVIPEGRLCGCGERGCLEAYAGGHALAARARAAMEAGESSALAERLGDETLGARAVIEAAAAGDNACKRLLDEAASHLGLALANLCTVLAPNCLLLGGSVLRGAPPLLTATVKEIEAKVTSSVATTLEIHPAMLADDAGLIGAALAALDA